MNWEAVANSLREQASENMDHAEALAKGPFQGAEEWQGRSKTIERHRINVNLCMALAEALEAGLEK